MDLTFIVSIKFISILHLIFFFIPLNFSIIIKIYLFIDVGIVLTSNPITLIFFIRTFFFYSLLLSNFHLSERSS